MLQFSCIHLSHQGRLCATPQELTFASNHPLQLHWENIASIKLVTKKLHGVPSRMLAIHADNHVYNFHTFRDVDLAHHQLEQYYHHTTNATAQTKDSSQRQNSAHPSNVITVGGEAGPLSTPAHGQRLTSSDGYNGSNTGHINARRSVSSAPGSQNQNQALRGLSTASTTGTSFGWRDVLQSKPLTLVAVFLILVVLVFVASTLDLMWTASRAVIDGLSSPQSSLRESLSTSLSVDSTRVGDSSERYVNDFSEDGLVTSSARSRHELRKGRKARQEEDSTGAIPRSLAQRQQLDESDTGITALLGLRPAAAMEALRKLDAQLFWLRVRCALSVTLLAGLLCLGG